ncbi:uncharacterized protein RJT20DRAFT_135465 [Scheffersomyces xylosifermentans]|uniref:uncharacterized protein n=1 Tax=Scheffersomyces xylosifermentans TaxID=1304137 RepID=UPI00315D6F4A
MYTFRQKKSPTTKDSPLPFPPANYDDDTDSIRVPSINFDFGSDLELNQPNSVLDANNLSPSNAYNNRSHNYSNNYNSNGRNTYGNFTRNTPARSNRSINPYTSENNTYPYSQPNTGGYQPQGFASKLDKELPILKGDDYELANLRRNDRLDSNDNDVLSKVSSYSPQNSDPFVERDYDMIPLPSPPSDPFAESNAMDSSRNNLLKNEMEGDRQRRNERERIRLLRSKPRFHYTRWPFFTLLVTVIQVVVFIVELARMANLTGSAFQTKPYFNPMLGPSTYLLINMGARYVPCMSQIIGITDDTTIMFPCANSTTVDSNVCSLAELCGMSGVPTVDNKFIPHQWYRVITPIFLHAGFLHIIFNLLLQMTMGASIERHIGTLKYIIIYLSSGIGGFLLGANFTPNGIASTGASGALFGVVATNIMLFIYCGKKNTNLYGTKHYFLFICIMIGEIIISLVLGLLPGLDNFSHIGGFAMGILTAIVVLPDPFFVYIDGIITYRGDASTWQQFLNAWNPKYAWEDKIATRFVIWATVRVIALILAIVYFVTLIQNFFKGTEAPEQRCKWCKYINCIPVRGWCDIGEVSITTSTSPGSSPSTTNIATPSTALITTVITTSAPPLPSSIENSNSNSGSLNKLFRMRRRRSYPSNAEVDENKTIQVPEKIIAPVQQLDAHAVQWAKVFEDTVPAPKTVESSPGVVNDQNIGMGIYLICGLFAFMFLKKKKLL